MNFGFAQRADKPVWGLRRYRETDEGTDALTLRGILSPREKA